MEWTQNQIIIGGIILVLVAGGVGFWLGRTTTAPAKTATNPAPNAEFTNPLNTGGGTSGGDSVRVSGQQSGMKVAIDAFTLAKDGWVVIHEDANEKPGNILGAQRSQAGTYPNGTVELLRSTESGKTYYAMLHADDGDHAFDKAKDLPVLMLDGSPVMASFIVQ